MIGYYILILTSVMVLIVVVIRIFKVLSARKQPNISSAQPRETGEEYVAGMAAVSSMVIVHKLLTVSAWPHVEKALGSLAVQRSTSC